MNTETALPPGSRECKAPTSSQWHRRRNFVALAGLAFATIVIPLGLPNSALGQSDLAVTLYPPVLDTYVNDWVPFYVDVTNLGPYTVPNVSVTVNLATWSGLVDVSPANQSYTYANNTLTLSFSSLTNLETRTVAVRVKPTVAIVFPYSASISASGNTDPNSANNTSSVNVSVGTYPTGSPVATIVSTQFFSRQVTAEDQWIQVSNAGPSSIDAARVILSGLAYPLWNAAGTNNGNPYVIYPVPLAAGQSGNLLLQFATRSSFPFANSQMTAAAVTKPHFAPPAHLLTAEPVGELNRLSWSYPQPSGVLLQFQSFTNRNYTILYSDNPQFTNPMVALPYSVLSEANWAEFIDSGPPATISFPTNTAPRYYRVYLDP